MLRNFVLLMSALSLGACAGSYRDGRLPTTKHLGQAVHANTHVQAAAARDASGATDGARAAEAVETYREGPARRVAARAASDVGSAPQ